jgi:hypothetical protein
VSASRPPGLVRRWRPPSALTGSGGSAPQGAAKTNPSPPHGPPCSRPPRYDIGVDQPADLLEGFPHLGDLLGRAWLARVVRQSPRHWISYRIRALSAEPLQGYSTIVPVQRRARALVELGALDRAIAIVGPVSERNDRVARFRGSLQQPTSFLATVAELFSGARFARMTSDVDTMVIDPPNGGPDCQLDLGKRRLFAEVYAPDSWRDLDLADDIRGRFKNHAPQFNWSLIVTRHAYATIGSR